MSIEQTIPMTSSDELVNRQDLQQEQEQPTTRVMPENTQFVHVSCYTRFDNLAHGPRGTQAPHGFYTFKLDPSDGQLVLYSISKDQIMNPAFSRVNPQHNLLYTCTESVAEDGEVISYNMCPTTGKLRRLSSVSAKGTSTCYLTIDKERENMLVVNYWNSTIGVFGLNQATGEVGAMRSMYDPNEGRPMKARASKHVNHSENDGHAQKERQSDPHSHAVVLDPTFGRIAYVPDLGKDLIRQFLYDQENGVLHAAGTMHSGIEGATALGPRYIEFHPTLPVCYVVNELSSEVAVYVFDREAAEALINDGPAAAKTAAPTLRLIQTVKVIPDGFPLDMNTCGRIHVHSSGNYVFVSNRGHDSITVLRVHMALPVPGMLSICHIQHTRGATPRHFSFDLSGQWLISANQDSNAISVFRFNMATGRLDWTGHKYQVPSPNFVCCVAPSGQQRTLAAWGRHANLPPRSTTSLSTPQGVQPRARL